MNEKPTPRAAETASRALESVPGGESRRFRLWFLGCCLALLAAGWLAREPLRRWITRTVTLANEAPLPDHVEDVIEHAADPQTALVQAWQSGRIVQREVAVRSLAQVVPFGQPLPGKLESLLLAAAADPDMNVRESAFGILRERHHPALLALAAELLKDPDPQMRVLGLEQFKFAEPAMGVPAVMPLLDDSDLLVVSLSLKWLEHWSGEKFGVRLSDTVASENAQTGLQEYATNSYAKVKAGAERAKAWWAQHRGEFFPPAPANVAPAAIPPAVVPAGDFQVRTLEGRPVRLSDYRGKVVLINFWTTWCTACVSEMPELIALQKEHGNNLVILGISLDAVPDEHGGIGGEEAEGAHAAGEAVHGRHALTPTELSGLRAKVARMTKLRGLNYPVALDEQNEVGGRFNGGELPTTVVVDPHGNVRRRFVGTRPLPVFEAMVAEAARTQP